MKISIGKLAKIFGLTKEGLRFYERNNMIEPSRDDSNGYRFYSGFDVQKVAVIKKMKNLGFSLDEIKDLMAPIEMNSFGTFHKERLESLEKELKIQHVMIERLKHQQEIFDNLDNVKEKPEVVETEGFYHLDFGSIETLINESELIDEVSKWFQHMHIVSASSILPKGAMMGEDVQCHKGLILSKDDAELLDIQLTEHMKELPRNKYVKVIAMADLGKKELPYVQMLPSAKKYITDNDLTITGSAFTRVVTSFVNEEGNGVIISELYVPID
jgi:DNA-binding transcriptional MerR regulator